MLSASFTPSDQGPRPARKKWSQDRKLWASFQQYCSPSVLELPSAVVTLGPIQPKNSGAPFEQKMESLDVWACLWTEPLVGRVKESTLNNLPCPITPPSHHHLYIIHLINNLPCPITPPSHHHLYIIHLINNLPCPITPPSHHHLYIIHLINNLPCPITPPSRHHLYIIHLINNLPCSITPPSRHHMYIIHLINNLPCPITPPSHHHLYIIHLINGLYCFYRITMSLEWPFIVK